MVVRRPTVEARYGGDRKWYAGCAEFPNHIGEGHTRQEAIDNLAELIRADLRQLAGE